MAKILQGQHLSMGGRALTAEERDNQTWRALKATDGAIKELKDRLSSMIESAMKKQRNS